MPGAGRREGQNGHSDEAGRQCRSTYREGRGGGARSTYREG